MRKSGITRAALRNVKGAEKQAISFVRTHDSYQNFAARLGLGTNNISSGSTYGFDPISRIRTLLEWMYRGSWIVGQAVDCIAEDMTKAGVSYIGENEPQDMEKLQKALQRHLVWPRLQDVIKWARLYGGALGVILIDGANTATPLKIDRVAKGSFKGLLVLDRWMVEPSFEDLVDDINDPDLGDAKFYRVTADAPALPRMKIHHSRVVKIVGVGLPYWQKVAENLWGISVIERLYDRLVAFDSATQGASQLMYRAHLRTLKIKNLRKIVTAGGKLLEGLVQTVNMMRQYQSNEGVNMIDAEDEMEATEYTFGGVSDTILQFGQQLSGALQIPLVRLFGQSPQGLNSTGESDIRTYYDGINQRQETQLRHPFDKIVRVEAMSEGIKLDPSFGFIFNPLWQLTEDQKSTIAQRDSASAVEVEASGLVSPKTVLKELRQGSRITGRWSNITDEEINAAEDLPVPPAELDPAAQGQPDGNETPGGVDVNKLRALKRVGEDA